MNKCLLIGRITKDLELRHTKNDKSVCEFTLATQRDKDNADFITCQVWGIQAENLCKYQEKGSLISVVGELRVEQYQINDKNHYKTFVLVNQVEFLSSKQNTTQKEVKEANNPYQDFSEKVESDIGQQIQIEDSDLPF